MKYLNFYIFFLLSFSSFSLFAQRQQQIESDLLKPFKNIVDYADKYDLDKSGEANGLFAKKLKSYCEKIPATLSYPFRSLVNEHLDISTSSDGQLRIYSWDTWSGGTMHVFESMFQYKSGDKMICILDAPTNGDDYTYNYDGLSTFKANNKVYYLVTYLGIYSTKDVGEGIKVFTIETGKLKGDVKIIKTNSGLHGHLYYDYDFMSIADMPMEKRPKIIFDALTKTIKLPLVDANDKVTDKFITYKFTGQYFERVKN